MSSSMVFWIKWFIGSLLFYVCRIFPIKNNKIVCCSFLGKGYGDNGKAIIQSLVTDGRSYDIVWLYDPASTSLEVFPDYIRPVPIKSVRAIYELSTAKIWIDNKRKPLFTKKRSGQFYMVTCHGNNGIKRVEFDIPETLTPLYLRAATHDSEITDVYLSASIIDSECFRSAYRFSGELIEKGYPRQDILFQQNDEAIIEIKKKLGIGPDVRIVLYAPTFRQKMNDLNVYNLDWTGVLAAMEKSLGGQWIGLVRLHPNISEMASQLNIPSSVLNVTDYPDFDELALISDCLITDYSSTIIEAGIAGKIGFFFAVDIDDYKEERDFYIPLEEWPFPLASSNNELIQIINSFNNQEYELKRDKFFSGRYGLFTPGHAAEHAANRIRKEIGYL